MLTVNCTGNEVSKEKQMSNYDVTDIGTDMKNSSELLCSLRRKGIEENIYANSQYKDMFSNLDSIIRERQIGKIFDSRDNFLISDKNTAKILHDVNMDIHDRIDKKVVNLFGNDKNVNNCLKKEVFNQSMNNRNMMKNNKDLKMKFHDSILMNKIGTNQYKTNIIVNNHLITSQGANYLKNHLQSSNYERIINRNMESCYEQQVDKKQRKEGNQVQGNNIEEGELFNSMQIVKGPWSKEEDNKLVELINCYGPKNWSKIADLIKTRIGKQCRERWHNHLHPSIKKTPFTSEEDILVIKLHNKYGNRWSEIAKFLPGRTDNAIKNHWNSALQKKMKKRSFSVETPTCLRNDDCGCVDCLKQRMHRRRSEGICVPIYQKRRSYLHDKTCNCRNCVVDRNFTFNVMNYENEDVKMKFEQLTENERIASLALLKLNSFCK